MKFRYREDKKDRTIIARYQRAAFANCIFCEFYRLLADFNYILGDYSDIEPPAGPVQLQFNHPRLRLISSQPALSKG